MLGLASLLPKFQAAWAIITDKAPDALDKAADFLHKLEEGVREGAEWLRNLGNGTFQAGPEDAKAAAAFESLRDEVRAFAAKPARELAKQGGDDAMPAALQKALAACLASCMDEVHDRVESVSEGEEAD
jgi:hypothetical protein